MLITNYLMLDTVFLMLLGGDAILLLAFIHSLRSQERNEIPLLSNEALLEFQYLGGKFHLF